MITKIEYINDFGIYKNFKMQGVSLSPVQVTEIKTKQPMLVFNKSENYIVIFWASWCAPCKVEMSRLKKSVNSGAIPQGNILAINLGESEKKIRKFMSQNKFPFTFIDDKGFMAQKFNVMVTPTTILVEKGKTISVSSGLSLIGIFRAENLFK